MANLGIFIILLFLVPTVPCEESDTMKLISEVESLRILCQELQMKLNDNSQLEVRVQELEENIVNMHELEKRVVTCEATTCKLSDDVTSLQSADEGIINRLEALEVVIDERFEVCLSSPCQNGATCVDVNVDTFVCLCRDGFFGLMCNNSFTDTTFLASLDADTYFSGTILFPDDRINPGGHYNPVNGAYTAPHDGIYQFSIQLQASLAAVPVYIDVFLDGFVIFSDQWAHDEYRSVTFIQELAAAQVVTVGTSTGLKGSSNYLQTYFSGHLVFPN